MLWYSLANGILAQWWWFLDHWPAMLMAGLGGWHVWDCRRPHHRIWLVIMSAVAVAGAAIARNPTPYIMTLVSLFVTLAVYLDRNNPDVLRFRAMGGMLGFGLAAMGSEVAFWMLTKMDVRAYAEAVAAYGEARAMVSVARRGLYTMVSWGLWLIMPLGILGMIIQGMVTHPPQRGPLETLVDRVRTSGYGGQRAQPRNMLPQQPAGPPVRPPGSAAGPVLRGQGTAPAGAATRRPPVRAR